jgi:hypothetical protein
VSENLYEFTGQELEAFGKKLAAEREALLRAAQALLKDLCSARFQAEPGAYIASQTRFDAKAAYLLIGCPLHGQTVVLELVIERAEGDPPAHLPAVLRTSLHGEVGMRILDVAVTPELRAAADALMSRAMLEGQVRQERDGKALALWATLVSLAQSSWSRDHADKLSLQLSGTEHGIDEITYRFRFDSQSEDPLGGSGVITCAMGSAEHPNRVEIRIDLSTDAGEEVFSEVSTKGLTDRIGLLFSDARVLERRREAIRLGADPVYASTSLREAAWQGPPG